MFIYARSDTDKCAVVKYEGQLKCENNKKGVTWEFVGWKYLPELFRVGRTWQKEWLEGRVEYDLEVTL
jgi:hypothetical protein